MLRGMSEMCYICGLGFWFAIAVGLVLNLSPVYDSVYPEGKVFDLAPF